MIIRLCSIIRTIYFGWILRKYFILEQRVWMFLDLELPLTFGKLCGRNLRTMHNGAAIWLRSVEAGLCSLTWQSNLRITLLHVQTSLNRIHNWIAPGTDFIHSFWWKKLCAMHPCLPDQLQEVLEGSIPEWLVMGRTTLIQKDKNKCPVPSNYRPITCLPTIWKLLTSILCVNILLIMICCFISRRVINRVVMEQWIIYVWIKLF